MKRLIPLLLPVMLYFALAACKRDGEVKTILVTIDSFTTELVNRVEKASNRCRFCGMVLGCTAIRPASAHALTCPGAATAVGRGGLSRQCGCVG